MAKYMMLLFIPQGRSPEEAAAESPQWGAYTQELHAADAWQDAFAAAAATWPRDGVPARPGAWITTTARRKAIDRLRRERGIADRVERMGVLAQREAAATSDEPEESAVADDRLRLM